MKFLLRKTFLFFWLVVVAFVSFSWNVCRVPLAACDLSGCPLKMAVSLDLGRLGNQFFEYLAARVISDALGVDLFVTSELGAVYDRYFNGRRNRIVDWTHLQNRCNISEAQCQSLSLDYFTNLGSVGHVNSLKCIIFEGYPVNITAEVWQSIYSQRNELVREFEWKPNIMKEIERKLKKVRSKYQTVVGVHVRRTDIQLYLTAYYGKFRPTNVSYYGRAINYFRNKYDHAAFLIFSDDMNWCRKHLVAPDILYAGGSDPGRDLALLSSCDHLILSYGTFGSMAAWFSNAGEVIVADNYTQRPEAMVENLKHVSAIKWIWTPV